MSQRMTWIVVMAAVAGAWVMLGIFSAERKQRVAQIELSAAIERTRKAADAAKANAPEPAIELSGPQN